MGHPLGQHPPARSIKAEAANLVSFRRAMDQRSRGFAGARDGLKGSDFVVGISSMFLDAASGTLAERRAVPAFVKGVSEARHVDHANRVSADERDGDENDFHGLCITPAVGWDC